MLTNDRNELETHAILIRVPSKVIERIDEIREREFYKSRQEVILEAIRDFIKNREATA